MTLHRSSSAAPHLMLMLSVALWSLNPILVKVALRNIRPLEFVAARYVIGSSLLLTFLILSRRRAFPMPRMRAMVPVAVIGIMLNQLTFTLALRYTTAVDVTVLMGLSPIAAAAIASAVDRKPLAVPTRLALAGGLTGLILVTLATARGTGGSLQGDALALVPPATWAIYLVLVERYSRSHESLVLISWSMLLAAIMLLVPAAADLALLGSTDWLSAMLPLGASAVLATTVAYALYFSALPRIGVVSTAMYIYAQPAIGVLFAAALLGEPFGPLHAIGILTIAVATYFGSWRNRTQSHLRERMPPATGATDEQ